MQADSLQCSICYHRFNATDRLPKVLACGHTLCIVCLDKVLKSRNKKCPLDQELFSPTKTDIVSFPTNFTVLHIIQENSQWEICENHGERKIFACMTETCKTKLCSYEAGFEHKGHNVRELVDIKPELEVKRKNLENSLENLELYHNELGDLLEEQRQSLLKVTKERFEELSFLVKMKELEMSLEIDFFFNREMERIDKVLGKESAKRNNLRTKIEEYKIGIQHKDIFKLIEDDITQDIENLSREILRDQIVLFTEKSQDLVKGLEKSLLTFTVALDKYDFSLKILAESLNLKHPEENVEYVAKKVQSKMAPFEANTALVLSVNEEWLDITAGNKVNQATVIKAQDWKDIRKIRINLEEFEFKEDDMRILTYVSRAIEQISCVKLNAKKQKVCGDRQFITLFNILFWKPQDLQEIELNFDWRKISDQPLMHFAENILAKGVNLRTLNLNLYKTSITDQTIKSLGEKALPYLKQLENFEISLGELKQITDQGIEKLFCEMPSVRKYKLGLVNSKMIGDNGLIEFMIKTLPSMTVLEELNLRLLDTKVTDASIMPLFGKIKGIKTLDIDLSKTKVSDDSVKAMLKAEFMKKKILGKLEVELTNTAVTEDAKKEFNKAKEKVLAGL